MCSQGFRAGRGSPPTLRGPAHPQEVLSSGEGLPVLYDCLIRDLLYHLVSSPPPASEGVVEGTTPVTDGIVTTVSWPFRPQCSQQGQVVMAAALVAARVASVDLFPVNPSTSLSWMDSGAWTGVGVPSVLCTQQAAPSEGNAWGPQELERMGESSPAAPRGSPALPTP